jgi:hypothetical protein
MITDVALDMVRADATLISRASDPAKSREKN